MASEIRRPGYIAILPSKVRYDPELRPNAKLLYAEITALADDRGYCFARNDYFAKLFGLAPKSVSRLISMLGEKEYINVEIIRDPVTSEVIERRLWVDTPPRQKEGSPPQDGGNPPPQKEETPPRQKAEDNDLSSFNDIPPISPKGDKPTRGGLSVDIKAMLGEYARGFPDLYGSLEAFMEVRSKRKAVNSPAAVKLLLSKLDKLSGGNDILRQQLVDTAIENGWKSVYPLKAASPGTDSGGRARPTKEARLPEW